MPKVAFKVFKMASGARARIIYEHVPESLLVPATRPLRTVSVQAALQINTEPESFPFSFCSGWQLRLLQLHPVGERPPGDARRRRGRLPHRRHQGQGHGKKGRPLAQRLARNWKRIKSWRGWRSLERIYCDQSPGSKEKSGFFS